MKNILFKISELPKRQRRIVYIAAGLIAAFLFDKVILQTARSRIKNVNNGIFIQEKRLQKYLQILSKEDLVTSEYQKYTEGVSQGNSEEEEKLKLLSEVEKIARNASVVLKDIKPGPTKAIGLYKKYTIEIEVESEMNYLIDFIYQLEKTSRLLRIEKFQLRPKEAKSKTLKTQMTITQALIEGGKEAKKERMLP